MASYSLATGSGEKFNDTALSKLMLGNTTGIVVSDSENSETRLSVISSIDKNVADILDLLSRGISVSINTPVFDTPLT